jgi:hypothetical protein
MSNSETYRIVDVKSGGQWESWRLQLQFFGQGIATFQNG